MTRIYLHPLIVRLWHWVNAVCFGVLIVTGIQLRYAGFAGLARFRTAVTIHNIFGFAMIAAYGVWLLYYLFTGKIRLYVPLHPARFVRGALLQARYYGYGLFVGEHNPHHASPDDKFNPLQQSAYFMIMLLLMPVQIVTGILLWDVQRFADWINLFGGLKVVDIVHVLVFFCLTAFLFVHVYLTTLGATPLEHIRAMITGYEEGEEPQEGGSERGMGSVSRS